MTAAPIIRFEAVSKSFGRGRAVSEVTLDIAEGEFFALLGPSGCGKTTLLRMLAGFETPSAGRILIDGIDVSRTPPNKRPVNMVFQSYAVFPHMSVAENVAFGLRVERTPAPERRRRVEEALALVKLDGLGARRPDQLSGGQRQRVALARALVKRPRVLLLDEPLSALDAKLREAMQVELGQLQAQVGITFLFVTHDQEEALAMASRCAVMNQGALEQVATPMDLYQRPASRFVADFIGQVNLFEGRVAGPGRVDIEGLANPLEVADTGAAGAGDRVWLAVRPEAIDLAARAEADDGMSIANRLPGVLRHATYLGVASSYAVEIEGGRLVKVQRMNRGRTDELDLTAGSPVWLSWPASAPSVLLS
jgi:spermidine/putrescine transport system ATP-binding protein